MGFRVYHPRAGKKCIGITIPGNKNNSWGSMVRGNFAAIGISRLAKLIRVKSRLKTISPLIFNHLSSNVYPAAANTPPNKLAATILTLVTTAEKSASLIE